MKTTLIRAMLFLAFGLPLAMAEEPGKAVKGIRWSSDLIGATAEALAQKKLLVVVMVKPVGKDSTDSKLLMRELLSKEMLPLAGRAIFVIIARDLDAASRDFYEKLGETSPTVSAIAVGLDRATELGRLAGVFSAVEIRTFIEHYIAKHRKPAEPGFFERSGVGQKIGRAE